VASFCRGRLLCAYWRRRWVNDLLAVLLCVRIEVGNPFISGCFALGFRLESTLPPPVFPRKKHAVRVGAVFFRNCYSASTSQTPNYKCERGCVAECHCRGANGLSGIRDLPSAAEVAQATLTPAVLLRHEGELLLLSHPAIQIASTNSAAA